MGAPRLRAVVLLCCPGAFYQLTPFAFFLHAPHCCWVSPDIDCGCSLSAIGFGLYTVSDDRYFL